MSNTQQEQEANDAMPIEANDQFFTQFGSEVVPELGNTKLASIVRENVTTKIFITESPSTVAST